MSKSSFRDAADKIAASGAQVYTIAVSNQSQPSNRTGMLRWLADDSGGRCFRIGEGAARIFNVLDDLHSARVVTCAPPPAGADFHSIVLFPQSQLDFAAAAATTAAPASLLSRNGHEVRAFNSPFPLQPAEFADSANRNLSTRLSRTPAHG
jgi:hypothetical protein